MWTKEWTFTWAFTVAANNFQTERLKNYETVLGPLGGSVN